MKVTVREALILLEGERVAFYDSELLVEEYVRGRAEELMAMLNSEVLERKLGGIGVNYDNKSIILYLEGVE